MSENTPEGSQGHPAWQSILDQIPNDLHSLIVPELEKMDKHTQGLVQGLHEKYDPYKPFVEGGVDPSSLHMSLQIANHLQSDPEDFVRKAIENFGLDNVLAAAAEMEEDPDMTFDPSTDDISQHPEFKALMETVNTMNQTLTAKQQQELAAQEAQELDEYLDGLQETVKDKGEFDRLYVSALMANGLEGEKAVDMYFSMIDGALQNRLGNQQPTNNGQQQQTTPPVVMGGAGNAGSGNSDQSVSMGNLKKGEVSDLVAQMINNMNNQT